MEREFALWADSLMCDAMQMHNFYELQQIAFLSFLASGELFATLPYRTHNEHWYSLRVQLIESDRVSSPSGAASNILNGVELGRFGEVVAYYVCSVHPLATSSGKKEWVRVEKFGKHSGRQNLLHLMESERPEQRRGVPLLAPVIESLKQLDRYSEAELTAALVSSLMTVFIETTEDEDGTDGSLIGEGVPEEEQVDQADHTTVELAPGSVIALAPGEKANVSNPARNNTSFDPFVTAILRQVGAALEIPYEILVKHFSSSYSASRAALLEAWKMFKMRRHFMANRFCQPIYEEWLTEAILMGRIVAPGFLENPLIRKAYCSAEWNGPSQGQLDPLKEVNAAIKRVEAGFSTRARETMELNGGDYWRNHPQRVREEEARRAAGFDADYLAVIQAMAEKEVKQEDGKD